MPNVLFQPGKGIDPIRLGMTRDAVVAIMGEPAEQLGFQSGAPLPGELGEILAVGGTPNIAAHVAETFSGQLTDIYNEGGERVAAKTPNRHISEVTYIDGTVSKIVSINTPDPIMLDAIELTARDSESVVQAVHTISQRVFLNGDDFYFPDLGLIVLDDLDQRARYVALTDGRTEAGAMAEEEYEEMTPEEFVEFFADDEEAEDD